jgi:hypothetical protein
LCVCTTPVRSPVAVVGILQPNLGLIMLVLPMQPMETLRGSVE